MKRFHLKATAGEAAAVVHSSRFSAGEP